MIPSSFGDMSRFMATHRQTSLIKRDLARLTEEMSSGKKSDLPRALGVNRERAADIGQRISRIDGYLRNATHLAGRYKAAQVSLEQVDTAAQNLAERLIASPDLMSRQEKAVAGEQAKQSFATMVDALSTSFGGVNLFSGAKSDTQPLPDAANIMTDLRAAVDLSGSAASIQAEVEAFFEADTGPYVTSVYQGAATPGGAISIGDKTTSTMSISAISKPIRRMLAGAAMTALINDPAMSSSPDKQKEMLEGARDKMQSRDDLTILRADLGVQQEFVEEKQTSLTAERFSLAAERNDLTKADPYETASRLQQVQLQLETHFTITGRLSRLSLVNYLP